MFSNRGTRGYLFCNERVWENDVYGVLCLVTGTQGVAYFVMNEYFDKGLPI